MNRKITAFQLCLAAMAACINVAGGQLALTLRLPVYLDSIGTILVGIWMGPVFGMVPNLVSGVILGLTTDVYSLYFAPVGMITGFMAGLAGSHCSLNKKNLFLPALAITVPGTVISSLICAVLFGGITSSGSTILVQLLAKTPLGMTASVFVVQIVTDYLDRLISLFAAVCLLQALPSDLKNRWKGGKRHGRAGRTVEQNYWKESERNLSFKRFSLCLGKMCILRLY